MNNFNFGEVLTRAWQIVWKHKVLWVFGILASCGQGSNSSNSSNSSREFQDSSNFNPDVPPFLTNFANWMIDNTMQFVIILIAIVCIFWIIALILSAIGRVGLIQGTVQADGGAESLIFGQLFSESMPYIWKVIGLSILLSLPILVLLVIVVGFVIVSIGATLDTNELIGEFASLTVILACCCLLVPVMFILGLIFRQAERAVVLEELGVLPALSRGWEIFRANLGPIILMGIILAIMLFIANLIISIPVLIIVFPAMLSFIAGGGENTSPLIFMLVCICLYIPVSMLLQGIVTAYSESAWTLTYTRLTRNPTQPPTSEDSQPLTPEDSNKTLLASNPNA